MGVSCEFPLEQLLLPRYRWFSCFQVKICSLICLCVICSSVEPVLSRCDDNTTITTLNYNVGDYAKMNCKVPVNLTKSNTNCRKEKTKEHINSDDKYARNLRAQAGDIILIVKNLTINDSMIYECGYADEEQGMEFSWVCCFNLTLSNSTIVSDDIEEDEEGEDETTTAMGFTTPVKTQVVVVKTKSVTIVPTTNLFISTLNMEISTTMIMSNEDSFHCVLTNKSLYLEVCTKENVTFDTIQDITKECEGNDAITPDSSFNFTFSQQSCKVTCLSNDSCIVETGNEIIDSEGDDGVDEITNNGMMQTIFYILCGTMVVLLSLAICLCFYLFADKGRKKKVNVSNYSYTLPEVVVAVTDKNNQNNVHTISPPGCEFKLDVVDNNCNETDDVEIRTLDEGWEHNIVYETVNQLQREDEYAALGEDILQSHESDLLDPPPPRKQPVEQISTIVLYETVIK